MEYGLHKTEIETLYGMLGTLANVAKYLGLAEIEVRKMNLRAPAQIVRNLSYESFVDYFIRERGAAGMAKRFYVSESFIVAESERRGFVREEAEEHGLRLHLKEELKRLGSVAFVAARYEVTPSEVRRHCKEQGFDPKDYVRIEASGKYTAGLGRQAELAFAEMRGDNILEDKNRTDGSKALTDFIDKEFGRVNVKSSQSYRSKRNKGKLWKINTEGLDHSDYLAAVLYDAKRENVLGYWIRPVSLVNVKKKTITLHEKDLKMMYMMDLVFQMPLIKG